MEAVILDNSSNLCVPVRERIFTLLKSRAISQKEFAKAIKSSAETVTAWKAGRNFSYMKKLKSIANVLNTTVVWLLTGKDSAQDSETANEIQAIADSLGIHLLDLLGTENIEKETSPMSGKVEIELDPELLATASELLEDLTARLEADAAALARLDSPEAKELAQDRLEAAKLAESLSYYFGTR